MEMAGASRADAMETAAGLLAHVVGHVVEAAAGPLQRSSAATRWPSPSCSPASTT